MPVLAGNLGNGKFADVCLRAWPPNELGLALAIPRLSAFLGELDGGARRAKKDIGEPCPGPWVPHDTRKHMAASLFLRRENRLTDEFTDSQSLKNLEFLNKSGQRNSVCMAS